MISRALVICPHTDDELACGGLIIRLIEQGCNVLYCALSRCEETLTDYPPDTLELECKKSTDILGISDVNILKFPVHNFPEHRQEILELFLKISDEYNPDLVIVPSSFDTNQDHATVYQESFRAFKHTSMLGYEHPQNTKVLSNTVFITLTEEQLYKKITAIRMYKSQYYRSYMSADFIRGLARVRGVQCDNIYAESYEMIRWII